MSKNTGKFLFVADHPCLDFLNTQMIQKGEPVDTLATFADFLEWIRQSGIASMPEASLRKMERHPDGERVLSEAKELRKLLREMVVKLTQGKRISESTLERLNHDMSRRAAYPMLLREQNRFAKRSHDRIETPEDLLSPIAESAADLLCFADFSMIRKCEDERCILYFYDTTRNHARRWCSMNVCGNRHKAATHYEKTKKKTRERRL